MRDIQEVIVQKEGLVAEIQREIEALRVAARILEGSTQDTDKPKSQPKMVVSILEEVGKPMHVGQIAEQMKRKFKVAVKRTNLGVLLFRYSQRGSQFYKVQGKPNTYGLLKWQAHFGEKVNLLEVIK